MAYPRLVCLRLACHRLVCHRLVYFRLVYPRLVCLQLVCHRLAYHQLGYLLMVCPKPEYVRKNGFQWDDRNGIYLNQVVHLNPEDPSVVDDLSEFP